MLRSKLAEQKERIRRMAEIKKQVRGTHNTVKAHTRQAGPERGIYETVKARLWP